MVSFSFKFAREWLMRSHQEVRRVILCSVTLKVVVTFCTRIIACTLCLYCSLFTAIINKILIFYCGYPCWWRGSSVPAPNDQNFLCEAFKKVMTTYVYVLNSKSIFFIIRHACICDTIYVSLKISNFKRMINPVVKDQWINGLEQEILPSHEKSGANVPKSIFTEQYLQF